MVNKMINFNLEFGLQTASLPSIKFNEFQPISPRVCSYPNSIWP